MKKSLELLDRLNSFVCDLENIKREALDLVFKINIEVLKDKNVYTAKSAAELFEIVDILRIAENNIQQLIDKTVTTINNNSNSQD